MAGLMRAITAAELEIEGELSGSRHQALLRKFGEHNLDAHELAQFPDYLVCINVRDLKLEEDDELMEMLSRGVPVKVLVRTDDLLPGQLAQHRLPGVWSTQSAHRKYGDWLE